MSESIFTNWTPDLTARWGKAPLKARHRLHEHPLFSFDALADLIDRYPREKYALVHTGARGSAKRTWQEGEVGAANGRDVIEAIKHGRIWLNLRNVADVDPRYRELLEQAFEEVRHNVPGYETYNRASGILISSPNAEVYYHADLPGQSLWQIHGRKRVFVYPNTPPYLTAQQLEHIALYEVEVDMAYDPSYDAGAEVFEIGGGDMLHWPLNAPHRVENLDCLNVSMTTEYWTEHIRRRQMVNLANAILRDKIGWTPHSTATTGLGFWAKSALQAGVRRAGLLQKSRKARRPIKFRLDPREPGRIVELRDAAE